MIRYLRKRHYQEDQIESIKKSHFYIGTSLNFLLIEFQEKLYGDHLRTSFIIHQSDCIDWFKEQLSTFRTMYNITPNNHTLTKWYNICKKLEFDARESFKLTILENPDIKHMTEYRNSITQVVLTQITAKRWGWSGAKL